jgi:nucleoside-diphosphate-sugar epimerase
MVHVIGSGLIARAIAPLGDKYADSVAFATGVADSTTTSDAAFVREIELLYPTIKTCISERLRLIYFSGAGALYGEWDEPVSELSGVYPHSAYGRHQLACESVIRASGVRYLIARLPNLVGHSQNSKQLVAALTEQIRAGRVTLQSAAQRDLLGAEDLAVALDRLLEVAPDKFTVIVASGRSVPVTAIAEEIATVLGIRPEVNLLAGGDQQRFNIDRLSQLLKSDQRKPPDYYRSLLRWALNQ